MITTILVGLVGLTILLGIFGILNIIKFSFKAMTWTLAIFGQMTVDMCAGAFWLLRLAFRLLRGIAHVAIYGLLPRRPTITTSMLTQHIALCDECAHLEWDAQDCPHCTPAMA